MVTSTKFASLVGSVTLAFVLASSLHPVQTAPVAVRRQDVGKAPAGYISVAQPAMSEQDIYAMGIPDAPPATNAAAPAGYVSVAQPSMNEQDVYSVGIPDTPTMATSSGSGNPLEQVLKAAAQAALKTSNSTMNVVNHYDATPAVSAAANPAQQVSQVAQPATADVGMKGNPDEGALFQQVNGATPELASMTMQGNPDEGNAYNQIVAQQMAQFGAQARRALGERMEAAVMHARQSSGAGGLGAELEKMEQAVLGNGVPTPSSATMVASADAAEVTGAAATAATGAAGAVSATASDLAGIPVAAPVPSDFSSPPAPSPSSNLAVPGVPSVPAVPAVPSVSNPVGSVNPTPALPTSNLPTSALPTSVPSDVPSAAVPSASVPAAVPSVSAPAVPAVPSAPAVPSVSAPSLNAAAASATTVLPLSDANPAPLTKAAGDLTMTVTVPTKALPTSIAGLPNVKPNNANADDDAGDWKTMTILVPAEAFGGIATGVKTQINLPASSSAAAASATSSAAAVSDKNEAVSSTASPSGSVKATPTSDAPINISSFTSLKPAATSQPVLTIPLTGVIGGTTYSTMLTLTIPRFGGEATASSSSVAAISTSSVSVSATEKANSAVPTSAIPTKTSSSAASVKPTSSSSVDDPSYINPNDIPPLLKSSMTATPTSAPSSTPTNGASADDEDCEEYEDDSTDQNQSGSRSLLTKVWDWVTGKPLNERDFADDYEYGYDAEGEEVWYDAQQE